MKLYLSLKAQEYYGTSKPTSTNVYRPGTKVINMNPAAGDYVGWIYTKDNVWKGFGLIESDVATQAVYLLIDEKTQSTDSFNDTDLSGVKTLDS